MNKIHYKARNTLGSVWVIRNLCLDSCSLNRAALTKGTDWSRNPPPASMPAVIRAVSRSVYVLLITSAWLWSIVTFWNVSRRKPRRRPRTLGRALAAPRSCNFQQHSRTSTTHNTTLPMSTSVLINERMHICIKPTKALLQSYVELQKWTKYPKYLKCTIYIS